MAGGTATLKPQYAVSRDGRFLINQPAEPAMIAQRIALPLVEGSFSLRYGLISLSGYQTGLQCAKRLRINWTGFYYMF